MKNEQEAQLAKVKRFLLYTLKRKWGDKNKGKKKFLETSFLNNIKSAKSKFI